MTMVSLALAASLICSPAILAPGGCLDFSPIDVVSIYDGDTIRVVVDGWPPILTPMSIRLLGYDTPEMRGKCALESRLAREARTLLTGLISSASHLRLVNVQPGKYFRLMGRLEVDGYDVGSLMIMSGLARPYDGGRREGWCR